MYIKPENLISQNAVVAVYQDVADRTQLYKVRTGCGHIVQRRMRPSTAGVPFTEEVVLEAPGGHPCPACGG